MRKIGEFLLAHNRNAIIVAFVCTLLPLIYLPGGFAAAIIVGLVTLKKGAKDGFWVLVWVALPAICLLFLKRFGVFDILLLRCVLVWLFAIMLRQFSSWRMILEVAVLLGFLVVAGLHLAVPDIKTWWAGHIAAYMKAFDLANAWKLSAAEVQGFIGRLVPFATGVAIVVVFMGTFIQLILARFWYAALFERGLLKKEFSEIRMGQILAVILFLAIVGAFLKMAFAIDFLPVILLPFVVAGLSFLHYWVARNKKLLIPLILIYVGLLMLPYLAVLILALLAFIDSWYDFRIKLKCNYSA